jgi:hypothetical protein
LCTRLCHHIEFKELSVNPVLDEINLYIRFENDGFFYDVTLDYKNSLNKWTIDSIYHKEHEICDKCFDYMFKTEETDFPCKRLEKFESEIKKELLNDPKVKEKIKNFRLEAITSGFVY